MKTKIHLLAITFAASALISSAQIIPDPVGVNTFAAASAFNTASYAAKFGNGVGGLGLYFASQATAPSAAVNAWGFVTQTSDVGTIPWVAGGGTVKTIFLGESAGASNDFGFIQKGANINSTASYTSLATNIMNGTTIQSGWETSVNYSAGQQLDFWLNNPGGVNGAGGTYFGLLQNGVGSAFAGGDPYAHTKFSWTTVFTEYQDSTGATVQGNVSTLLLAYEDLRGPALPPGSALPTIPPGDGDYTDFIVAFQFLPTQLLAPVPEPSTYGLVGAFSLIALLAYRRFKAKPRASAAA